MLNSYIETNIEVIKKAVDSRYANGNDVRLVNPGPIALFSNFKLTTSSAKQLESISHAHIEFLRYKLITSSNDSDDLSIASDRDWNKEQNELTKRNIIKGKYHVKIRLKNVFGFAEDQEKATFGFGYDLTLTRNNDDTALQKAVDIADATIGIDHIHWYIPHCTSSIQQQDLLTKQIFSKTSTEHRYVEGSVFMKEEEIC